MSSTGRYANAQTSEGPVVIEVNRACAGMSASSAPGPEGIYDGIVFRRVIDGL